MSAKQTSIACAMLVAGCLHLAPVLASPAYNETIPSGNTTVFGVKRMSYGLHLFALSNKGFLVHQVTNGSAQGVGEWLLMPNPHQGSTPSTDAQTFDSDPIVGQNSDGRLEVFARSHISLDYWHYYQVDATDPYTWVGPREPACLCNFPPCDNQTKCGNNANCGNDGYDCTAPGFENSNPKWWNTQAVFPTSDGTFVSETPDSNCESSAHCMLNLDNPFPHTGNCKGSSTACSCADSWGSACAASGQVQPLRLVLYFRGFDGLMYSVAQKTPGNSTKYLPPQAWGTLLE